MDLAGSGAPSEGRAAGVARHRALGRAAGFVLSAGFFVAAVLIVGRNWSAARGASLSHPGLVGAAVALNVLANALLCRAWRDIVAAAGPRLPYRLAARIWSRSQLTRFVVSAAPMGARAVLARPYGVTGAAASLSTLVEILWASSIGPLVVLATLPWWLPRAAGMGWVAWFALIPVLVLVVTLARPDALPRVAARALDLPVLERLARGRFAALRQDFRVSRGEVLRITGLLSVNAGLRLAAYLLVLAGLGVPVPTVALEAVGAFELGQLVGRLAIFAPGGIGPREGAIALVLAPLVGARVALLVPVIARAVEIGAELVFLGLAELAASREPAPRAL